MRNCLRHSLSLRIQRPSAGMKQNLFLPPHIFTHSSKRRCVTNHRSARDPDRNPLKKHSESMHLFIIARLLISSPLPGLRNCLGPDHCRSQPNQKHRISPLMRQNKPAISRGDHRFTIFLSAFSLLRTSAPDGPQCALGRARIFRFVRILNAMLCNSMK